MTALRSAMSMLILKRTSKSRLTDKANLTLLRPNGQFGWRTLRHRERRSWWARVAIWRRAWRSLELPLLRYSAPSTRREAGHVGTPVCTRRFHAHEPCGLSPAL